MQFFLPSLSVFRSTNGGALGISGCAAETEWVGGFVVISEYAVGLWSQQSR